MAYEGDSGLDRSVACVTWLNARTARVVANVNTRNGHVERERFLFSPGVHELKTMRHELQTDTFLTDLSRIEGCPYAHAFAIDKARELEDLFSIEAGRAYNVDGVTLTESWRRFGVLSKLERLP